MSESLGPAVMDEFPQVVGLQDLLAGERAPDARGAAPPAPATPAPPVEPVELPKDLLKNTLTLFDTMLSLIVLKVDREPPEIVQQLADSLTPLANYYAQGRPTVAVLWGGAAIALAGYGYAKFQRVQDRKAAQPAAPTLVTDDGGGPHAAG